MANSVNQRVQRQAQSSFGQQSLRNTQVPKKENAGPPRRGVGQLSSRTVGLPTGPEVNSSLTADAALFRSQTASLLADSVLKKTQTGSLTADAIHLRTSGVYVGPATRDPAAGQWPLGTVNFVAAAQRVVLAAGEWTFEYWLSKNSSPTDNLVTTVRANTASLPGAVIATIGTVAGSSLTTSPTRVLSDPVFLPAGTYWVSFARSGAPDNSHNYGLAQGLEDYQAKAAFNGSTWTNFGNPPLFVVGRAPLNVTVDAIALRAQTSSFTLNAVIKRTQASSFTVDAYIPVPPVTGSFTADAVLGKTQAVTLTADAVLKKTITPRRTPSFVQEVGSAGSAGSVTSLTVTLGAGKVTAIGNHLVMPVVTNSNGTLSNFTVTDSRGNTWQGDRADASSNATGYIYSTRLTTALVAGDTITLAWNAAANTMAATVAEYDGLAETSWLDQVASNDGPTATASDSGPTPPTTYDRELLVGAMASGTVTGGLITPETLSPAWAVNTVAVSLSGNIRGIYPMYRIVSSAGAYSAKATWVTSRVWSQIIVTYASALGVDADAIIRRERTATLTADAVLSKTVSQSHTADAVVLRTQTGSFTSDSVLLQTNSANFAADAVLKRTFSATFSCDAVLQRAITGSATANAVTQKTQTSSTAADAVVLAGRMGGLTGDAVFLTPQIASLTADAYLLVTIAGTGSFTVNAVLAQTASASSTADAVLQTLNSVSITADAVLRRSGSASMTVDAAVQRTASGSFTADAITFKTLSGNFLANAVLQKTSSATFAIDAFFQIASSNAFTANATLLRSNSTSLSSQAVLRRAFQSQLDINAVLQQVNSASVTADASLISQTTQSFTANATLFAQTNGSFAVSSWVRTLHPEAISSEISAGTLSATIGIGTISATISATTISTTIDAPTLGAEITVDTISGEP